jgi:hypothetical protein
MGCRSGMPSSQERAGRRPPKAKVTRSNRVGCAKFQSLSRRRESQALPRKRDGSIGFPLDGGCSHRLNRAVANASFWIGPRRAPSLPSSPTTNILRFGWHFSRAHFQTSGRVNLVRDPSKAVLQCSQVDGGLWLFPRHRVGSASPLRNRDRQGPLTSHPQPNTACVSDRPRDHSTSEIYRVAYRSVNATSRELKTGLNIYRMIDLEPV